MPKITDIYNVIKRSDRDTAKFDGLAYGITNNEILGLPNGGAFTVLSPSSPFGAAAFKTAAVAPGKMPIQQAFKDVLIKGYERSKDQTTLFIDLADLDDEGDSGKNNPGNPIFFTEGDKEGTSIAQAIADLVNKLPHNVKPVIRFLRGTSTTGTVDKDGEFWNVRRRGIEAIFWKVEGGELVPRITHPDAELHVGYYSPNFKLSWLMEKILKLAVKAPAFLSGWKSEQVDAMFDTIMKVPTFSASWNHGKIVAIGGKTVMTGGINYWHHYTSQNNSQNIIDMQAMVTGDAAASAQGGYLDYFWKYLNSTENQTDHRSFKKSVPLNKKVSIDKLPWRWDKPVPLFKSLTKLAPQPSTPTTIPVLSVARVGDWSGRYVSAYPVQAVDAVRDIVVNWEVPSFTATSNFSGLVDFVRRSSDDGGGILSSLLKLFNCSPAAWASDTARIWAIRNAKRSVYASGQMIVGSLQRGAAAYMALVKAMNKGLPAEKKWDGYLWPYDLLLAFAELVIKFRGTSGLDPAGSEGAGIKIVLGNTSGSEWGDSRTVADITSRVVPLVRGLDKSLSNSDAEGLVARWLSVKRIDRPYDDGGKVKGPDSIHTKTICVDSELLYVGSDNLYPCYNEEHGIWVDDAKAVKSWMDDYWSPLWKIVDEKVLAEGVREKDKAVSQLTDDV
ncbi:hypothetical protein B0T14DRAFT_482960 [Immersiella caudata]|uniref:PLD phosphodiesterase domain-containing protein n=1 Tax=Immersiella caudata TaxID=314043 RepID=A0AA39WJP2_9PEZI|nr:hypothetical protein B0T14DRAFT_482960 [Immersiella caudata]